jgi:hypothetical protein
MAQMPQMGKSPIREKPENSRPCAETIRLPVTGLPIFADMDQGGAALLLSA